VKLLLDTNLFLEVLLEQANASAAIELLRNKAEHALFLSDYALHSIATWMIRKRQLKALQEFLADIVEAGRVHVAAVPVPDLQIVIDNAARFGPDFDDAYQFTLADRLGLTLVSFDHDFDRTSAGRKTPGEILV
jgi:predicted nucleic acid-binding protein